MYDVAVPSEAWKNFTVTLTVQHGTMTLMRVSEKIEFLYGSGLMDDTITIKGDLITVNEALRGLNYLPDRNWNSYQGSHLSAGRFSGASVMDMLSITVADSDGKNASSSVDIFVQPVNDPPMLFVGSRQTFDNIILDDDDSSRVSIKTETLVCYRNTNCPIVGLHVRDIDVIETAGGTLTLTLTARNGSIFFDPMHVQRGAQLGHFKDYVAVEGDGGGRGAETSTLTVTLSPTTATSDFDHILYRPWDSFTGHDRIVITVTDNGNTGYDSVASDRIDGNLPNVLTDIIALPVEVLNRADKLRIEVPDGVVDCQEDSTCSVPHVAFVDLSEKRTSKNSGAQFITSQYRLDISSGEGQIELMRPASDLETTFSYDHYIETGWSHIAATGELYDLNKFVEGMYFTPSRDFNILNGGLAKITLTVTDTSSETLLTETNYLPSLPTTSSRTRRCSFWRVTTS